MKEEVVSVFKILSEKNSKGTEETLDKYQSYILTNLIVLLQGWPVLDGNAFLRSIKLALEKNLHVPELKNSRRSHDFL
jgi:hypothetical protein